MTVSGYKEYIFVCASSPLREEMARTISIQERDIVNILELFTIIGGISGAVALLDRYIFKKNIYKKLKNLLIKIIIFLYRFLLSFFLSDLDLVVLGLISMREIGYKQLLFAGKQIYDIPDAAERVIKSIIKLRKSGLIERSVLIGGIQDLKNQLFKTTKRGIKKSIRIKNKYPCLLVALNDDINSITGPLVEKTTESKKMKENREIYGNILFILKYDEDIDLPYDSKKIVVKAFCQKCMIELEAEYGPAGSYSAIESYSCPCCNVEIDAEIYQRDESRALSNTTKKKLSTPLGTTHD